MKIKKTLLVLATLIALVMIANLANTSLAQDTQSPQVAPGQPGGKVPQPQGGVATVIGVDQPDNCLRIRSGPGDSYDVIDCANLGQQLNITGVWTSNNWAQLVDNGWVYGAQIQTDLRPPAAAYAPSPNYEAGPEVVYYEDHPDTYLPDYGFTTYWCGGVPVIFYSINVWRKFHPWWCHKRPWWEHKKWDHHHRVWTPTNNFRHGGMTSTQRNFVTNRSGSTSSNMRGFDTGRFRSGSSNVIHSNRTFSSPNTIRMGNFGAGQLNRVRTSGFSGFSNAHMGATRFGGARFGGGMSVGGGRHR